MTIKVNPLLLLIFALGCIAIISGTSKEDKFGNYAAVYNDNDYIVLKRNHVKGEKFLPNTEYGKLIRDSVAVAEIKMYREKNPGATRYIDFNFHSLLGYVSSFQNVENPDANKTLGVRIYPALDLKTKQLTVIISPTRDNRALWVNKNMINGRDGDLDIEPFNTGSLCPANCPDLDTAVVVK